MSYSNSKGANRQSLEKNPKNMPSYRELSRTQAAQKPKDIENVAPLRPASGKKAVTMKVLPKKGPIEKVDVNIEELMTQSNIQEARSSLKLLKKKMSQNGKSKERISEEKAKMAPSLKKIVQQVAQTTVQKKGMETTSYRPPKGSSQKTAMSRKEKKQEYQSDENIQQLANQHEEQPLNINRNFDQILEDEIKKDNADPSDDFIQCSLGCGRCFNQESIAKHEKICRKVFQSKRTAFNTAAKRQVGPEVAPQRAEHKTKVQPKKKIPKWKLQSAELRMGLKEVSGAPLTKEEKNYAQIKKDSLTTCNFCGRKFNQNAAERHITFCEKKSKEMPRMNVTKRR